MKKSTKNLLKFYKKKRKSKFVEHFENGVRVTGDEGAPIPFSPAPPKWEKLDPDLRGTIQHELWDLQNVAYNEHLERI